ncbi:MAG: energy-coupling factor ABC transporter ATP-binding protein [Actinomycetia bacterium]|nr:energy-coupling factor ABC transporter ATP-binding protein [Actinomycetes bacterium]
MRLQVSDLTFSYGDRSLFEGVSFSLEPGQALSIDGPSGSGKSTLCLILAGLIPRLIAGDLRGEVSYDDIPLAQMSLTQIAAAVAMVFQTPDQQLFLSTVEDELAFACENLCLPAEEIGSRIDEILDIFSLEPYRMAHPDTLSGGQRQLVTIASILMMRPHFVILDEALSQLDENHTQRVLNVLERLKQTGTGLIIVDHRETVHALCETHLDLEQYSCRL